MSTKDWIEAAIGGLLLLALLVATLWWVGGALWIFTVELYREMAYGRHGWCYKCKKPYEKTVDKPVDQMYGPGTVSQGICSCGGASFQHGNRRFAEW